MPHFQLSNSARSLAPVGFRQFIVDPWVGRFILDGHMREAEIDWLVNSEVDVSTPNRGMAGAGFLDGGGKRSVTLRWDGR